MKKVLLHLLTIFFVLACNSSKDEPEPTQPQKTLTLITTSATPGEAVIAKADAKLDITGASMLKVGTQQVKAIALDSSQVMFILPVVPAGKVMIDYSGVGVNKQLELTVGAYTPITDPEAVMNAFVTEVEQISDRFEEYTNDPVLQFDPAYSVVLEQQKDVLQANFTKLPAQEKLILAYLLRNIMPNDADFVLDAPNPNNYRRGSADPGEELVKTAGSFKNNVIQTVAYLAIGAALMQLPEPTLASKVTATVSLTVGLVYLMKARAQAGQIGSLKGVAEKLLEEFKDRRISEVDSNPSALRTGEVEFQQGKPKKMNLRGEYRTLVQADNASGVALISGIFKDLKLFQVQYNTAVAVANQIRNWFNTSGVSLPAYQDPIRAQAAKKVITLPASKVSVRNVSDANIQLAVAVNTEGGFNLVATSSAAGNQDKPFSFEIVYTDSQVGVTLAKKISAVLRPVQPHKLSIVDGDKQVGEPGQSLAKPLQVKVVDVDGKELEGVEVEWSVKEGGGTLSAAKTNTNAQGLAQVTWTMNKNAPDEQVVEVLVKKADGTLIEGAPAHFSATVRGPGSITIVSGNNQSAPATFSLHDPLMVEVRDKNGVLLPNAVVRWKVSLGGGKILLDSTITGASGRTTNGWQLGPRGVQAATATVRKANGTLVEVTFTAQISEVSMVKYAFKSWICTKCVCDATFYDRGTAEMELVFNQPPNPEGQVYIRTYWSTGYGPASPYKIKNLVKINSTTYSLGIGFCWGGPTGNLDSEIYYIETNGHMSNMIKTRIPRP